LVNVFFRGYGQWIYVSNPGDPDSYNFDFPPNDLACGVFKLSEDDETEYRLTKRIPPVSYLRPCTTHPDSEFSKKVRNKKLYIVEMREYLTKKDAKYCYFDIDQSKHYELDFIEPSAEAKTQKYGRSETDLNTNNIVTKSKYPWILAARKIGKSIYTKNRLLSIEQIADKTHTEMTARMSEGEEGMTGRGGKVPSSGTIKRHALGGLKA
jgi:hypothetical protein